jgi:FkbM family methyltransferase
MNKPTQELLENIRRHISDDLSRDVFNFRLEHSLRVMDLPQFSGADDRSVNCHTRAEFDAAKSLARRTAEDSTEISRKRTHSIVSAVGFELYKNWKWGGWNYEKMYTAQPFEEIRHNMFLRTIKKLCGVDAVMNNNTMQYFGLPGILPLEAGKAYVDCGAFDGYNAREFVRQNAGKNSVYGFEPNPGTFTLAKKKCKGERIRLINKGVGDKRSVLQFSTAAGSSRFSENGGMSVAITTIDEELKGVEVGLIKMDIEGFEMSALRGAENTIREQKPKLAICVYHKLSDAWTIPEYILSLNLDYRLYFRHYPNYDYGIMYETVCYAV